MSEKKEVVVEQFSLDEDFDLPQNIQEVAGESEAGKPAEEVKVISKTFNINGQQVTLEGESYDELLDQLARLKSEPAAERPEFIEPPAEFQEVAPLTTEELQLMAVDWNSNPAHYAQRVMEAALGIPFEQVKADLVAGRQVRDRIYGEQVGADFVQRHTQFDENGKVVGGDYFPSTANNQKVLKFIKDAKMPIAPASFDYALNQLNLQHALDPIPSNEKKGSKKGSKSTAIPTGLGYNNPEEEGALNDEEISQRLDKMSAKELAQLVNTLDHRQRR